MPNLPPSVVRPAALPGVAVCAALAGLLAAGGCGGGEPAPGGGSPPPPVPEAPPAATGTSPAVPRAQPANPAPRTDTADAVDHERFQRLAPEALRLMIAAAQRALPIAPLQERVDDARQLATRDVAAAADRLEEVVADLEALLADGG